MVPLVFMPPVLRYWVSEGVGFSDQGSWRESYMVPGYMGARQTFLHRMEDEDEDEDEEPA
jgi:hypothetical protein